MLLLVAAVTALTAEALRMSGPLLDSVADAGGAPIAALVALVVFGGPVLTGPLVSSAGADRATLWAVGVLVALRLAVQLPGPPAFALGVLLVVVALVALVLVVRQALAASCDGVPRVAVGVALGGAADVALRSLFSTWDTVWVPGPAAGIAAAALCLLTAGALVALRRSLSADPGPVGATAAIAVLGPYLALTTLVLTNPAFVASQAGIGAPLAGAAILVGFLLGIEAVTRLRVPPVPAAALLVGAVAVTMLVPGPLVAPAVVVAVAMALVLLARALRSRRPNRQRRASVLGYSLAGLGVGGGFVGVVVPLPVPDRAVPFAAAALVGLAGLRRRAGRRGTRRLAPLAAVPGLLLAVPVAMLALAPQPLDRTPPADGLKLVSWNVQGAVTGDGAVDPEVVARALERQRPDVIVLQDVTRGGIAGGGLDGAEWLSRRLRMAYVWSPVGNGRSGNLILSRLRMSDVDRSGSAVSLELAGGRKVRVLAALGAWRRTPNSVVAGGFAAEALGTGLVSAQDATGHSGESTARVGRPDGLVDRILATPDLSFRDFAVLSDVKASDHYPIVVTVRAG